MIETLSTRSLERLPFTEVDLQNFSLVVCDLDYTLVDFDRGHIAGIKALEELFGREIAQDVDGMFYMILEGHRKKANEPWDERESFNRLIEEMSSLQSSFVHTYGTKVWSREAWIILSAKKHNYSLSKKQVENGRDTYWKTLGKDGPLYDDAQQFLHKISELMIPLIIMTGSESVVIVNDDLSLNYDPVYSQRYKFERLGLLPISFVDAVIGDPIDKPHREYFEKLERTIRKLGNITKDRVLIVGDSERNDLEVPRTLGYPTLLIQR